MAVTKISQTHGVVLKQQASFYLTKAWGNTEQNDFVNTVIEIETVMQPKKLLNILQKIEKNMGRSKTEKWGPRLIDIDILLFGNIVVNQPHLTIPHPFITERSFVIAPLYELNHKLTIPNEGDLSQFINQKTFKKEIVDCYVL